MTDDLVIIGADVGEADDITAGVHAFERSTGRQRWLHRTGSGVAAGIVGAGGLVFTTSLEGQLLALEADSGRLRWSFPIKVWGWEGPAVAHGAVFVGALDGSLYALDGETGEVEWRTHFAASISTSVIASGGSLFLGTADGVIHRVDSRRGTVLVSRKLDDSLRPRGRPVATADAVLVLLADKRGQPRAVVALDLQLDAVRWRRMATTSWTTARVFAGNDRAVVGEESGEVIAFCLRDGSIAGGHSVRAMVRSVGGGDGNLYVGTTTGTLHAIELGVECGVP